MNDGNFLIEPAFAVPFVMIAHPAPQALNTALRSLFIDRERAGLQHANKQPLVPRFGLFESSFDLFDWPDEPVQMLRDFCLRNLYAAVGQLNGYDQEMLKRLHIATESWFHITRMGGYFSMHNHALHSWSGVYCVDPGADVSGIAESGLLSFQNPSAASTMFVDMAVARLSGGYSYGPRNLRQQPGQLVLFPSWLLHEAKPFRGEGERITVAFNARFRLADAVRDQVPIHRD